MRAKKEGYICARSPHAYVYHKEGMSFKFFKNRNIEFEKNKKIFEEKYGKTKRIFYIFSEFPKDTKDFEDKFKKMSRSGDWIWVLCPKKGKKRFFEEYYPQVKIYHINKFFIPLFGVYKILSKKKPFTDMYVFRNKKYFELIKMFNVKRASVSLIK